MATLGIIGTPAKSDKSTRLLESRAHLEETLQQLEECVQMLVYENASEVNKAGSPRVNLDRSVVAQWTQLPDELNCFSDRLVKIKTTLEESFIS